ncbi:uncharacterized protein VTP21DRAFT_7936 [Calcarisporiella thermophila]|uniref:uncharacterized protein n=1 Tax=Calcarisporiella thermophila TaxID=911321 RepID=UPI0037420034
MVFKALATLTLVALCVAKSLGDEVDTTAAKIKRVVVFGIDGGGAFMQWGNTPNLKKFIKESAYSYKAKAMIPTISAQNWGSMIHGVSPAKHGLTNPVAETKPYPEDSPYPSLFKLVQKERPDIKMASIANWKAVNIGIIERSVKMTKETGDDFTLCTPKAVDYIKNTDFQILFIHHGNMDELGHAHGWNSTAYVNGWPKTDAAFGQILNALETSGKSKDTLVLVTCDHGGLGKGHGGIMPSEINVLFAARGPGIKPHEIKGQLRNMDTAAVMAHVVGFKLPSNWDAKLPAIF